MLNSKIFVIVPCYNEEECITETLQTLRKEMPTVRIVAVNDGSSDRTLEKLQYFNDSNLTILDIPVNSGIGTAMQTGLLFAERNGADFAVKFDGDGQHPATMIPALLKEVSSGSDLVIASRFLKKNGGFQSTFCRRFGIYTFRYLSKILTGCMITDATSGFRAYNRSALEFAARYYPSFDYPEPEESILFLRNSFKVKEIPCEMLERQGGRSSIRPHKALYFMFKVSFAMIMASLRERKRKVQK